MKKRARAPRAAIPQLNVRSAFAVKRARELAKKAGITTTKIVEDALRAYEPALDSEDDLWRRIDAITEEVAKQGPYPTMKEIDDEMYDEWGLPK